jgi:mRNA interferase RelE/StbE
VASYSVRIRRSAAKELESLGSKKDRQRIISRVRALAGDPRPPGAEKLSGSRDRYRVRQGDYRILYEIQDDVLIIVVKIGHRRDAYRPA